MDKRQTDREQRRDAGCAPGRGRAIPDRLLGGSGDEDEVIGPAASEAEIDGIDLGDFPLDDTKH